MPKEDIISTLDSATRRIVLVAREYKYSPDQPRDDHGRWTGGGPSGSAYEKLGTGEAYNHGKKDPGGIELWRDQNGALHWHTPSTGKFGGPHSHSGAVILDAQANSGLAIPDQPWSAALADKLKKEHGTTLRDLILGRRGKS